MDETGIGAHTDFTMFTILNQDSVGGLEVLNANAHWVPATPTPGTFVVNVVSPPVHAPVSLGHALSFQYQNLVQRHHWPPFNCGTLDTC